jgi:hypothetical protein
MSVTAVRVPVGSSQPGALEAWVDESGNLVIPAVALPRGNESVIVRHGGRLDPASLSLPRRGLLAVAAASALLIAATAMFAVHGRQWPWTGFAGSTSLWSWLRLLVQPVAIAFLTVRLFIGAPLRMARTVCLTGALLFALLILAGYLGHWTWTGFPGKALWDWLTLMLFPVVIALLPEWIRRGEPFGPVARLGALVGLGAFALLVVGGYHWGWTWTGFAGNTFRDWLDLMIAPFLIPLALKIVHVLQVMHSASQRTAGPNDLIVKIAAPH